MMIQAMAGAFALLQSADPAPVDGAEPPDPCRFGTYGPAAELHERRPPPLPGRTAVLASESSSNAAQTAP